MSELPTWLQELLKWLWEHLGELGLLLGGIGSIAGYYFSHWKAELAEPVSLKKLRPYLDDSPWRIRYRRTLARALDAVDRFFGPPISWRAYGVCLSIAFFYPGVLFLITWMLGGPHTLGTLEVFPKGWTAVTRVASVAGLALCGYIIYVLSEYADEADEWANGILARLMPGWGMKWHLGVLATVTLLLAGIAGYTFTLGVALTVFTVGSALFFLVVLDPVFAVLIAVVGTIVFATNLGHPNYFFGLIGILAFVEALPGALRRAFPGDLSRDFVVRTAGAYGVAAALFISLIAYLPGGSDFFEPVSLSIFLFLFLLPLLNAALDMLSWAASRWLGREMLDRNFHRWGMIGFATLDALLAFAFLCGLAVLLGVGGEVVDQLAIARTGSSVLDLDTMIVQGAAEPFGGGLWITVMLFSTLVPTAIHAFVAIGSVVQMRGCKEARARWRNEADEALANDEGLDPHACRKIPEHWLVDSWLPSVVLLSVLLAVGWFGWQTSVLPDALLAAVEWGRSLVG